MTRSGGLSLDQDGAFELARDMQATGDYLEVVVERQSAPGARWDRSHVPPSAPDISQPTSAS